MPGTPNFGPSPLEQYRVARRNLAAVWGSIYITMAFQVVQGLAYLFSERQRYIAPMFKAPEVFFSLRMWGVFLLVSAALLYAASRRSLRWTILLLRANGTIILFYAATFLVAAFSSPHVPWGQALLYLFVAAHIIGAAQFLAPLQGPAR